ncbi:MAG: CheR family methyltransferase, partial [Chromatiales bacterium]
MQPRSTSQVQVTPADYLSFQQFLQSACGIQLGTGKEYLVSSRLGGLMKEAQIGSLAELVQRLNSPANVKLRTRVIDAMTTNETFWFRDIGHYILLKETILPDLNKRREGTIRIWSAACSSGQEPYNISMVVEEYQLKYGRG